MAEQSDRYNEGGQARSGAGLPCDDLERYGELSDELRRQLHQIEFTDEHVLAEDWFPDPPAEQAGAGAAGLTSRAGGPT